MHTLMWRRTVVWSVTVAAGAMLWSGSAQAAIIPPIYDGPAPTGHSYVLGLLPGSGGGLGGGINVDMVTVSEAYWSTLYGTAGLQFVKAFDVTGDISNVDVTTGVSATRAGTNVFVYSSFSAFQNALTEFAFSLFAPEPTVSQAYMPPPSPFQFPEGIAEDDLLQAYAFFDNGIWQVQSYKDPNLIKVIGGSGPGALTQASFGLAVGDGILYALDQPNSRINRYDTASGDFLGSFLVSGVDGVNDMIVSSGWLYLTNGTGGVNVYDSATGTLLETYQSFAGTPDPTPGRDALYLDPQGDLYLYDSATQLHIFSTAPDPASGILAALGLIGVTIYGKARRNHPGGATGSQSR